MDYKTIRNCIVKGLHDYLKVDVVYTDNAKKKPKYPYLSYKFISLHIPQNYHVLTDVVSSEDADFEFDVEYTKIEQPKMILSISSYSNDEVEAYDLALRVKEWFKFYGYYYLKANGIIVNSVGNVQDRTIQIVDNYEKRQGFDVTIRVVDVQKMRIETIEQINMSRR